MTGKAMAVQALGRMRCFLFDFYKSMCYNIITDADGLKRESENAMKKLLVFLTLIVAVLLCLSACNSHEHSFGEGDGGQPMEPTEGIIYDISDDGTYAAVVGYEGSATKIKIADTYEGLPVKVIYSKAFYENKTITSVIIPDSVTSIGDSAFYSCDSLTSVVIGDSVTSIGNSAFSGCSSLSSIVIPDSVTSIGYAAFYDCSSLTSVVIGDSVTSIGDGAFINCYRLTSIVIPDSVTSIGEYAFYYCSNLEDVYYTGSKAEWQAITIGSYNSPLANATIHYNYVPEN